MKLAGFLLLLAGWVIAIAAVILLASLELRTAFVTAGVGIEIFGFVLAARAHLTPRGNRIAR